MVTVLLGTVVEARGLRLLVVHYSQGEVEELDRLRHAYVISRYQLSSRASNVLQTQGNKS